MFKQEFLLKINDAPDIQGTLQFSLNKKFCGLVTTVVNNQIQLDLLDEEATEQCFTRSPLVLNANQWLTNIFPLIKINSDLDSQIESVRENYEKKLIQEFNYAKHVKNVGYHYIQASCKAETLAKFLMSQNNNDGLKFIVEIQLNNIKNYSMMYRNEPEDQEIESPWNYWNELHQHTNYNPQFEVALVMTSDLPENDVETYRWLGEPVSMLVLSHACFITNRSNFPVLAKKTQDVVRLFMQYQKCFVVIEPKSIKDHRIDAYKDYLMYISKSTDDFYMDDYEATDSLRYPLQPLYDNLDSSTYETFERDPAKYILYQKAIEAALKDMISEEEKETRKLIILLVGAGRGPLIRAALNASANTNRKVKILAVEKNPIAIVTLSCLIRDLWPDKEIELIAKDMRKIQLEEKADIIVSELLGSFGDNELSPECLDGVQHLLKDTGISIPCNSKSFLQPIMTKRNYGQIQKPLGCEERKREKYSEYTEVNWLIYLTNVFHIDVVKELFTFVHPNLDIPIDNTRHSKLTFESSIDCVLHGFCGYFSSELYKGIEISIVPETHTQGMASWYSVFFPISKPIQLKTGDKIEIEFWRKIDETKVWYEWKIHSPEESIVHNLDGIVHPILL